MKNRLNDMWKLELFIEDSLLASILCDLGLPLFRIEMKFDDGILLAKCVSILECHQVQYLKLHVAISIQFGIRFGVRRYVVKSRANQQFSCLFIALIVEF